MARTRSKPAPKESPAEETKSIAKALPSSNDNPPKIFILPKGASKDCRIVSLDNPANANPSRYLFCPTNGFYEFTRIAAPKKTPKSWLITSQKEEEDGEKTDTVAAEGKKSVDLGTGYITKGADLFLATPIDLLFLILPTLAPKSKKEETQHFLCLDDHLDTLCASSKQFKALLLQYPSLKEMVETRMKKFCDTVDAGDETMYRISNEKLFRILIQKAERMAKTSFPTSMEEKFIKPTLDVPVMSIKREESTLSVASVAEVTIPEESQDSQDSTTSSSPNPDSQSTVDSISTAATTTTTISEEPAIPTLTTPPEVPQLLRIRTSFTYILHSYLPPTLQPVILVLLQSSTTPDFTPLDTHLAALSKLKAEAAALRSISDNISRKRGFEDDEEKVAEREEKKRKKEEEEKKKKSESRSIKQLKKADTSGMKKLSSFFTKAPAKKA